MTRPYLNGKLWLGILPNYALEDYEVQGHIDVMCRRMYVDRSAYNIEIIDQPFGLNGAFTRTVYAVRRPVENVVDTL